MRMRKLILLVVPSVAAALGVSFLAGVDGASATRSAIAPAISQPPEASLSALALRHPAVALGPQAEWQWLSDLPAGLELRTLTGPCATFHRRTSHLKL